MSTERGAAAFQWWAWTRGAAEPVLVTGDTAEAALAAAEAKGACWVQTADAMLGFLVTGQWVVMRELAQ